MMKRSVSAPPDKERLLYYNKIQYSKEIQQLVKELLARSQLSIPQRKAVLECMKNGQSLPLFNERNTRFSYDSPPCLPSRNQAMPKKRSKSAIVRSGAYEKEKFWPTQPIVDKEKEKMKLQSVMAYGKNAPPPTPTPRLSKERTSMSLPSTDEWFEELMIGAIDRLEFLQDMKFLGQEKKYRQIIEQQVTDNLRRMEKLDEKQYVDFCKTIKKFNIINDDVKESSKQQ